MEAARLTSSCDIAEYILERCGPLDPIKLQKLVYYCQAWSLVWKGQPVFGEKVQAWVHGPVVPELYQMHAQQHEVMAVGGRAERVTTAQRLVVDEVLRYYGGLDWRKLRDMTHNEAPWKDARGDLPENKPSTTEITPRSMLEFYSKRPCGDVEPVTNLSGLSIERVKQARGQLASGEYIGLDVLGAELASACR